MSSEQKHTPHTPGPWAVESIEHLNETDGDRMWSAYVRPDSAPSYRGQICHIQSVDHLGGCITRDEAQANARLISVAPVLSDLYASEINASVSWFWDGGFDVALGDAMNGWRAKASFDSYIEALEWLRDRACEAYPESEFAKKYAKADRQS